MESTHWGYEREPPWRWWVTCVCRDRPVWPDHLELDYKVLFPESCTAPEVLAPFPVSLLFYSKFNSQSQSQSHSYSIPSPIPVSVLFLRMIQVPCKQHSVAVSTLPSVWALPGLTVPLPNHSPWMLSANRVTDTSLYNLIRRYCLGETSRPPRAKFGEHSSVPPVGGYHTRWGDSHL